MESAEYWPFWIAGGALGAVVVAYLALTRRLLAVSGILARLVRWRADERERRLELDLATGALDAALLEATRRRFASVSPEIDTGSSAPPQDAACEGPPEVRLPVSTGCVFLLSLIAGGALAVWAAPGSAGPSLGASFERLFGSGAGAAVVLLCGGFLVGFGAKMAGGCTSGHGLCGLARVQWGSLAATAAMFAGGVGVSLLLGGWG